MRVLIVDWDIFGKAGGGQTAYAKLISANPQNDYYYFALKLSIANKPANAHPIEYHEHYGMGSYPGPSELGGLYYRWVLANRFAASAHSALGEIHFDVIDVPDYGTDALFIRPALRDHGITADRLVLALHGTISSAFDGDWAPEAVPRDVRNELLVLEDTQYRVVDDRYALARRYGDLWHQATGLAPRLIDPLHITGDFGSDAVSAAGHADEPPSVYFVGRREKRKGPDLFVDLLWAIGPESYSCAKIVGHESTGYTGTGSAPLIERMARYRGVTFEAIDALPFTELRQAFLGRNVLILPSRYDQFNLIALEALRLGCPVFLSEQAGAADWIREYYPALSDLIINLDCSRSAAVVIRNALQDYDGLRERIVRTIQSAPLTASHDSLADMYLPFTGPDPLVARQYDQLAASFRKSPGLRRHAPMLRTAGNFAPTEAPKNPQASPDPLHQQGREQMNVLLSMKSQLALVSDRRELVDPDDISSSIGGLVDLLNQHRPARVAIFDRLARLEYMRGEHITAALYDLRIMRWLGTDAFSRLPFVVDAFRDQGFKREADVTEAMYGDPATSHERCAALLDDQYCRLRMIEDRGVEIVDDRRPASRRPPKAAVIVSLYNAHTKLQTLLDNIAIQTLASDGQVEVVLVDSGSPGQEYAVFKQIAGRYQMPIVYVRSAERETIQSAWNRGILISKADYLCFLGVDEGMHPRCLEMLSDVLDKDPGIDWAMADSIVTEVTAEGIFSHDVMKYDRTGYADTLVYMDTCYLSWVGGLYRRDLHSRFGYYDESFRAAGDTEFKGRVLKHIRTAHVPLPYGVFNNYPEERTTQHPRAEIEDQRAWYLHRSAAGVDYLFENEDRSTLMDAFRLCMDYRKSYCGHRSTDFDFAQSIARRLVTLDAADQEAAKAAAMADTLVRNIRAIELLDPLSSLGVRQRMVEGALIDARALEAQAGIDFKLPQRPTFGLFNDNRFEQHWWSWSV